jgi:hypothetical protein
MRIPLRFLALLPMLAAVPARVEELGCASADIRLPDLANATVPIMPRAGK